jgi:hypothetical protein
MDMAKVILEQLSKKSNPLGVFDFLDMTIRKRQKLVFGLFGLPPPQSFL